MTDEEKARKRWPRIYIARTSYYQFTIIIPDGYGNFTRFPDFSTPAEAWADAARRLEEQ